jgi:pimeloyl-ACP methyl ester carboxylesterase
MAILAPSGFLKVAGQSLEYATFGDPNVRPGIVLLHEGLGCVSAWAGFPAGLAAQTGLTVFAYSRAGYGRSSPVPLPRRLDYMQREATEVLPHVLNHIGFERGLLLGHSDGASIVAFYAGTVQDHRIAGLALIAPHFYVEEMTVAEIASIRDAYETTNLRERLARHHTHVDVAFRGWNDAWLDPGFRSFDIVDALQYIRVPVLVIQGADDPYGTLRQVDIAQQECMCPVETVILPGCGHAPHREKPGETLAAVAAFLRSLDLYSLEVATTRSATL